MMEPRTPAYVISLCILLAWTEIDFDIEDRQFLRPSGLVAIEDFGCDPLQEQPGASGPISS